MIPPLPQHETMTGCAGPVPGLAAHRKPGEAAQVPRTWGWSRETGTGWLRPLGAGQPGGLCGQFSSKTISRHPQAKDHMARALAGDLLLEA